MSHVAMELVCVLYLWKSVMMLLAIET